MGYLPTAFAQYAQLQPAWSPDGQAYAFLSNEIGRYQLYRYDLETHSTRQLSHAKEDVEEFKWSPNGNKLLYLSGGTLTVMDSDGAEPMRLMTHPTDPMFFDWHPQGRSITYSCSTKRGEADICLKDLFDHLDVNLTDHPAPDRNFSWSPDGQWFAFGSDREGEQHLYLLNVYKQEIRSLPDLPPGPIDPVFAPDGRHLAFIADQDGLHRNFAVYTLDLKEQRLRRVSDTLGDHRPLWFPDGRSLLINTNSKGDWEFYRIHPDGSGRQKLGDGRAFSIHPDGTKVLVQSGGPGRENIRIQELR